MRRHLASATAAFAASIAALGLGAGAALADSSPTTTTPTTTTPTTTTPTTPPTAPTAPAPSPAAPVQAAATLTLSGAFTVGRDEVTVPNRVFLVQGTVTPYVAGQWVSVTVTVGKKRIKTDRLRIKPVAGSTNGAFTEKVSSPVAGLVAVQITHQRTAQMLGFLSARRVTALDENVGFGARGMLVTLIQRELAALHVYVQQSGVYDSFTGWAMDAYHRLLGWGVSQLPDARTVNALLDGQGRFVVKFPNHGTHAEGDLTHQLLGLIDGSKVQYILPISSGKPSTPTILGDFRVYSRVPGYLPDGMYYSDFFYSGYAIHGYDPAPDYPASHGCMRLPIQDAIFVYNWLHYNDWVDTYYR